ncbi:MAG TPA: GatB/YqeY domain-containing protein [Candidatus Saccharimonadales bacterium]
MIEQQIEQDIKTAMLARDTLRLETLRGLKSVFLYAKVASGERGKPLSDEQAMAFISKEAKKRQESADLYLSGGDKDRADKELSEKAILEAYLPEKLTSEELAKIVDEVIAASEDNNLGAIIGQVKSRTSGAADGAEIAKLVKEKLT